MRKVLFIILILLYSCEPYDGRLKFINQSEEILYYSISYSNNFKETNYLNEFDEDRSPFDYVYKLKTNDSIRILNYGKNSWNNYIGNSKEDGLYIYTFEHEVLNKNTWEIIYKENKYKSRKKYSINELDLINWEIKLPLKP